jgi:hypothetical protein
MCFRGLAASLLLLISAGAVAQSVQPVIVEYKEKADGKFVLTNNTTEPMAVVLEPRSFSISPDGTGMYRALDPGIHVDLSTMSVRLDPKQTYYVFYKAHADKLPAWFVIYSTFSPVRHSGSLAVRIMLPHTVYLYQKRALTQEMIHVKQTSYDAKQHAIVCDLENEGEALGRVQDVRATAGRLSTTAAGFPLLPGSPRHVVIDWKESTPPTELLIRFEHFTMQQPIAADGP